MSLAILAAMTSSARAEPSSAADDAFKKGRELLKDGKYAEACVAFEHSQALDPGLGTLFNIAQCDEKIGKLATALAAYRTIIAQDTNDVRKATSTDLANKLVSRVPKLVVHVDGTAPGLAITLGVQRIQANHPVELDFGDYVLTVNATDMREFTTKFTVDEEGRTTTLVVPLTSASSPKRPPEPETERPRSKRKLYGLATVGGGGAVIIVGAVFGSIARSKWNDATALCPGMRCATLADVNRANTLRNEASSKANLSTILFVAGGAIAAGGLVLWLTAPSEHAIGVSARASSDGGGITLSGRF